MSRPISETLHHIGGGAFVDQASNKLNDLVNAVGDTGKSGKLILEITVKKATRGGAMHITGRSTLKAPVTDTMEAMLFATPEGNLVADDPQQKKLDLKIADAPTNASLKNA